MPPARRDAVADLAAAIETIAGAPASAATLRRFARYADLLLLWNRAHRITGLESRDEVIRKLFVDSLLFLPLLPSRPISLVDIGAGAGIPGVPLALVDAGITATLIESRRKRVSFLSALKREIGLDRVQIYHGRAEDIGTQHPVLMGEFDVAVMRAVGRDAATISTAMTYLRPGGVLVASGPPEGKGPQPAPAGARLVKVPSPVSGDPRVFIIVPRRA
jgi:16S rRNA (guanine527-N7)-methyltransferase